MPDELDISAYADLEPDEVKRRLAYLEREQQESVRVTGSGGSFRREPTDEIEELHSFEERFNRSTRGSAVRTTPAGAETPAEYSIRDGERYMSRLLAARAVDHLAKHSKLPQMREACSRIDLNTLRPR